MRADGAPLAAGLQLYAALRIRVDGLQSIFRNREIDWFGICKSVIRTYLAGGVRRRVNIDVTLLVPRIYVKSIFTDLTLGRITCALIAEVGAAVALTLPIQLVPDLAPVALCVTRAGRAVVQCLVTGPANIV